MEVEKVIVKKKKQVMPKIGPEKFIRAKVVNKVRMINEEDKTIYVAERNGRQLAIKDGEEVVISEHVYNALKDSVEPIYAHVKADPTKDMRESPAQLKIIRMHSNYDITELSDWMDSRDPKEAPVKAGKVKEMLKAEQTA